MEAPKELFVVIDILALLASLLSVAISTISTASDLNVTKVFRPIFISYSLVSLCVTSLNLCDDVIRDVHNGYGGSGYIRLAVFGTNSLLVILHQMCLTYAEFLTIRSMTGKKSLTHGKSLLLVVWILGLSLFGCLMAFARIVMVVVMVSIMVVLVSFSCLVSYYMCRLRVHRNNRLYVERIRCSDIRLHFKTSPPDIKTSHHPVSSLEKPWKDIFIPRILLVAYYVAVLPFIFDLIAHLTTDGGKRFSIDETSRSAFMVIHDLYFILFCCILVYMRCTTLFPSLPKLR